jgi:hypothetical protein
VKKITSALALLLLSSAALAAGVALAQSISGFFPGASVSGIVVASPTGSFSQGINISQQPGGSQGASANLNQILIQNDTASLGGAFETGLSVNFHAFDGSLQTGGRNTLANYLFIDGPSTPYDHYASATVLTGGASCSNGSQTFTVVGGTGTAATLTGTVTGNVLAGALTLTNGGGSYTAMPLGNSATLSGGGCGTPPTISFTAAGGNTNRNYTSATVAVTANSGDGGLNTSSAPAGGYFGFSPVAVACGPNDGTNGCKANSIGATNLTELAGGELDVAAHPGSSMALKYGLTITERTDDAVNGDYADAGLVFRNEVTSTHWGNGIRFTDDFGAFPFDNTSTLIVAGINNTYTGALTATQATGGSGCTTGTQTFTFVGGNTSSSPATFSGTVAAGALASGGMTLVYGGYYTTLPASPVTLSGGGCSVAPTATFTSGATKPYVFDGVDFSKVKLSGESFIAGQSINTLSAATSGNGYFYAVLANGAVVQGNGTTYDDVVDNASGQVAFGVLHATQNTQFKGALVQAQTTPTLTLAGGTCAGTTITGGLAGKVTLTGACAASNTMTLSVLPTVAHDYVCFASDRNTPATSIIETSSTSTTAVLTFQGTTGTTDVIQYSCAEY